jgi:hypothetical protein
LAELTSLDPAYAGPAFHFDAIIRELIEQVYPSGILHLHHR